MNFKLNGYSLFGKFYRVFVGGCFFQDKAEEFIYFREKGSKGIHIGKISQMVKSGLFIKIVSYPRILISNFAKMPNGRKLVVFIMISFISYLMVVVSHLLKNKEKYDL